MIMSGDMLIVWLRWWKIWYKFPQNFEFSAHKSAFGNSPIIGNMKPSIHPAWSIRKEDFPLNGGLEEKMMFVLQYAILAPSTHNSQPWLFRIQDSKCEFYGDDTLRLPQADPTGRDFFMSLGACIENFIIAAKYFGIYQSHSIQVQNTRVAEVHCEQDGTKELALEPLVNAILARRTVRGAIPSLQTDPNVWQETADMVKTEYTRFGMNAIVLTDREKIEKLARIQEQGILMAYKRKEFRKEFAHWVVSNISRRQEAIPGYAITLPLLPSLIFPALVRWFNVGPVLSKINYKSVASAPVVCVLTSSWDYPDGWVSAGMAMERWMLECVAVGSAVSIYVASIEMGKLYTQVQELLGIQDRPQFIFLTGYITQPNRKPTARHSVEERIFH